VKITVPDPVRTPIQHDDWSYVPRVVSSEESCYLRYLLRSGMPHKAKPLKSRGPHVLEPRITAFYALDGHSYEYDKLLQRSVDDLSIPAIDLIERAYEQTGIVFDVAMINRYRNSRDKIGHHRDEDAMDEPVGSFSLGCARQFLITAQTRPAKNSKILWDLLLHDGSFMMMNPGFQRKYWHAIPPVEHDDPQETSERFNVTLRRHNKPLCFLLKAMHGAVKDRLSWIALACIASFVDFRPLWIVKK
jgi:alkylated DNA repair dioxygenase AlkB